MLLSDKVAIIAGGAKGIGRATAIAFAEQGCDVAIADISIKDAEQTAQAVQQAGRRGLAIECDITDGARVQAVVKQVVAELGDIDILVNVAGGITLQPNATITKEVALQPSVADITDAEWDRIVAVNLKGAFLFCREVVSMMKKRKYGKIINVSSVGAVYPPDVLAHYHAAKAGVLGLTRDLACELAPYNITVNAIMPGPIRTPFFDKMMASKADEEIHAFFDFLGQGVPMQRVGRPEEVAGVMLFLASEMSSYVTGSALAVAGGLPLKPNEAAAAAAKAII